MVNPSRHLKLLSREIIAIVAEFGDNKKETTTALRAEA